MIKIQIVINIEIFLFILIFIITKQIKIYTIFILFTLIHEISHVIMGIALGLKPKKFMIMPFGFSIKFEEINQGKNLDAKKIAIAAAGPAINILIMTLSIIFKLHTNIIYANLLIAIFNLIPIYPLDGGRILKSILKIKEGDKQSYYITNKISNITIIALTIITSILILKIKNIAIVCILAYLWYIVIRENKRYKIIKRIHEVMELDATAEK